MRGRPPKEEGEKAHYQLIAIDYSDYMKLKTYVENRNTKIKAVIHKFVEMLYRTFCYNSNQ